MKYFLLILFAVPMLSCQNKPSDRLKQGEWLGFLQLNADVRLPFNFEVTSGHSLQITNADEVILVDDISYQKDSIRIQMPVFEGYFQVKLSDERMVGVYVNESMNMEIPFEADFAIKERFETQNSPQINVAGNWEVLFTPKGDGEGYAAKGVFEQQGKRVTGTFQTKTGDYRYLEGVVDGDQLKLSTFDGAHAYLFLATVKDSTLQGVFYSSTTWQADFEAQRNEDFQLPDANTLTTFNDAYERLEINFPDEKGQLVSLTDPQFKDKVVVVQLMGTWCPNCLDESTYFTEFYKNNADKDIAFVALAFENAKTEALAFAAIKRLKDRLGITYPILLAQHGGSDKLAAHKKLPMLSEVMSYPTTIFLDRTGTVRKIHTGFNGPATGEKYVAFKKEFNSYLDELLAE